MKSYRASLILLIIINCLAQNQSASNNKKQKSPLIDDISELKDFKKLLRSKTNILVCFIQSPKSSSEIVKTFKEVAIAVKGQGTLVTLDCTGTGKKLCKKMKVNSTLPYHIKHYKDGDFHKDYDRKESVSSMVVFMRAPTGDLPWDEDHSAQNIFHIENYESLQRFIKSTMKRTIIMFYAPWCSYCKTLKPDYAAAATDLKGEAILAAIDMSKPENVRAGPQFNITGFPTLLYFENGRYKFTYEGVNSRQAIVSFIKDPTTMTTAKKPTEPKESWSATESDVVHLTSDDFDSTISTEENVLVVFYAPWCGHCETLKPKYESAAAKMKNEKFSGIFAAVDATKETDIAAKYNVKGYPTIKFFSGGKFKFDLNIREEDKIIEFMKNPQQPPPPPAEEKPWADEDTKVIHLNKETFKPTLKKKKHALVMFYAPWCGFCKKSKPEMNAAAERFVDEPRIVFGAVDCTQEQPLCATFNVKGYPTIKYFSFYDKEQIDYNGSRTEDAFVAFINNPVSPAANKNPTETDQFPMGKEVLILTDNTFKETVGTTQPTLIMFYASWCGHCNKMKPAYSAAAKKLSQDGIKGRLAVLECIENSKTAKILSIDSYPTVKLFVRGNIVSEYDGDRSEKSLYDFVKQAALESAKDEL